MTDELVNALDACLRALKAGQGLDAILARYPAQADELRPLLQAALAADRDLAVPNPVQQASRARFLARAADLSAAAAFPQRRGFLLLRRSFTTGLAFLLGFVLGTYGVVLASAQSLPGDQLYGIKRAAEDTQLLLAPIQARPDLLEEFAAERVEEVETLTAQGRAVPVEFEGLLQNLAGERWTVAGIAVVVTTDTHLEGAPFVGAWVAVKGLPQPDHTVLAVAIEIKSVAEPATAAPPAPVPSATPGPSPSAPPSLEPIGAETEALSATKTPKPTEAHEASKTPEAHDDDKTPSPSKTPEPDETHEPDSTDDHSDDDDPSPSNTPEP